MTRTQARRAVSSANGKQSFADRSTNGEVAPVVLERRANRWPQSGAVTAPGFARVLDAAALAEAACAPERIANARLNATRAGVTDRVTFVLQDLFATDVSPATVVTLYLGPDVNRRLRPKLLRELRPGTRIVSHDFSLGDWSPEQTVSVPQAPGHQVFLWRVPPR